MAVDLIDANTTRYFSVPDHADLTFPDSDWFLTMWTRVDDNSGVAFQYLFSNNGFGAANSLNVLLTEASNVTAAQRDKWGFKSQTGTDLATATATGGDGKNRLIVIQRNGSNIEKWFCEPMATATNEATTAYSDGAINGGNWFIGCRSDLTTTRFYEEHFGDVIRGSVALTQAQIELLARGVPPTLVTANLDVWFQFRENAATVVDVIGGHVATRNGTGLATSEHFPVIDPWIAHIGEAAAVVGTTGNIPIFMNHYRQMRTQ